MCLYETKGINRKYIKNKKNGGIIPAIPDERLRYIGYKCGKCIECRKGYGRQWQLRLLEDIKIHTNGIFITLTFSNESIKKLCLTEKISITDGYERDNAIATIAVRRFLERWRKKYKKSMRHFLITELGHNGTENIHLHGIVWTDNIENLKDFWKYGHIWNGYTTGRKGWVNDRTVNYIIKYITKVDTKHKNYTSKVLCSPGIGKNYIHSKAAKKHEGKINEDTYRTSTGHKVKLPDYWKNKIWTEEERERRWIQKLDTGEEWIGGENVTGWSNNGKENLKKWYQERNIEMGYAGKVNKKEMEKENERRNILIKKRINNAK